MDRSKRRHGGVWSDAWTGRDLGAVVFYPPDGRLCAGRTSAGGDARDLEPGAARHGPVVRVDVRRARPVFGAAGVVAARSGAARLYGIRSERLLCEQLGYNMLHRWFVGLGMEDAAWDH